MSLRSVVPALFLIGLSLTSLPAYAGHWVTHYAYTFTPPTGTSGYASATDTTTAPNFASVQYSSGTLTLTVTPTLIWTADGPGDTSLAPTTVSYVEYGAVGMAVADIITPPQKGIAVMTQTADDGLKDAKTLPSSPQYGVNSSGYHAVGPTSPTSLPARTVTATFTFNAQTSDPTSSGGGGASYALYPVSVTAAGCNSANQALTGQQITATLNGPGIGKITAYTWSFTGGTLGNPIKTWNEKGVAADGKTPQQLFPLLPTDLTKTDTTGNGLSVNPLSFYDQVKDTVTIKCALSLTFPDGKTGTVNAEAMPISFAKPTAAWTVNVVPPYLARPIPPREMPGFYSDNAFFMQAYEWWDPIQITDPTGFSGGMGCLAQTTTPSYTNTRIPTGTGHATYTLKIEVPPGSGTWVAPGTGLDGMFPYAHGLADDGSGHDGNPVYDGYMWDIGVLGHSQDVPALDFAQPDAGDNGGQNWIYAKTSAQFSTWLMFRPPAKGSQGTIWVPLQTLSWNWGGTANGSGTTWTVTSPSFSPGSPAVANIPPSWTKVIVNFKQHY